jgi:hypothetical protein
MATPILFVRNEVGQTEAYRADGLALSPRPDCEQGGTQEPPVLATASLPLSWIAKTP